MPGRRLRGQLGRCPGCNNRRHATMPHTLLRHCRRDLKRHLLAVEERCLESLAWRQGSSLYPALMAAVGTLGSSGSEAAQQHAVPPPQEQRSSPSSSERQTSRRLTPHKRGAEEMEQGVGADSDMPDASAHTRQIRPSAMPDTCAQGRLPLSLGHEPVRPAPAAAEGGAAGSEQQQAAAAGHLAAEMARGDRSARAAVSGGACGGIPRACCRARSLQAPHPSSTPNTARPARR